MQTSLSLLLFAAAALALWRVIARGTLLCHVRFDGSQAEIVRGRCPAALLDDLRDIARLEGLERAQIRIVSEAGMPRITGPVGISPGQLQQLRNVVGRYSVAQLRRGNRKAR